MAIDPLAAAIKSARGATSQAVRSGLGGERPAPEPTGPMASFPEDVGPSDEEQERRFYKETGAEAMTEGRTEARGGRRVTPGQAKAMDTQAYYNTLSPEQKLLWDKERSKRYATSANKMYEPTQQMVGDVREARGRERGAMTEAESMRQEHAEETDAMADMQLKEQETQMHVDRAKEMMLQEDRQSQMDAMKAIQDNISKASEKLASAPDIDPGRWWANKSGGFKFKMILRGMMRGLSGRDPMDMINTEINRDIDAQKAGYQQQISGLKGQLQHLGAAQGLYQDIRSNIGDEVAADATYRAAKIDAGKKEYMALLQSQGQDIMQPQFQQQLAQFDQEVAKHNLQLEGLARTTPKTITRQVGGMSKFEEKMRLGEIEHGRKMEIEGTKQAGQMQMQQMKSFQQANEKTRASAEKLGEKMQGAYESHALIGEFLDDYKDEIYGYGTIGATPFELDPDSVAVQDKLRMIRQAIGRAFSQGAINEAELEEFEDMTNTWRGESDLRSKLGILKNIFDKKIQIGAAGYSDDARAIVAGTPQAGTRKKLVGIFGEGGGGGEGGGMSGFKRGQTR